MAVILTFFFMSLSFAVARGYPLLGCVSSAFHFTVLLKGSSASSISFPIWLELLCPIVEGYVFYPRGGPNLGCFL